MPNTFRPTLPSRSPIQRIAHGKGLPPNPNQKLSNHPRWLYAGDGVVCTRGSASSRIDPSHFKSLPEEIIRVDTVQLRAVLWIPNHIYVMFDCVFWKYFFTIIKKILVRIMKSIKKYVLKNKILTKHSHRDGRQKLDGHCPTFWLDILFRIWLIYQNMELL